MKNRYRLKIGQGYKGCEPITIYWVQVRKEGLFFDSWKNVKGFESRKKLKTL